MNDTEEIQARLEAMLDNPEIFTERYWTFQPASVEKITDPEGRWTLLIMVETVEAEICLMTRPAVVFAKMRQSRGEYAQRDMSLEIANRVEKQLDF